MGLASRRGKFWQFSRPASHRSSRVRDASVALLSNCNHVDAPKATSHLGFSAGLPVLVQVVWGLFGACRYWKHVMQALKEASVDTSNIPDSA